MLPSLGDISFKIYILHQKSYVECCYLTFSIRNIKVMEQMIPLENDKVKTKKEKRVISYSRKRSSHVITSTSQPAITCSKLTIAAQEQSVKCVQSQN